jgi:hypothetical protein
MDATARLRAASVAAVLLLLSACTSGEDGPPTRGAAPSPEASTPVSEPGEAVDPDEFVRLVEAGYAAVTTARTRTTARTGGLTTESEGVIDLTGREVRARMTLDAVGAEMEVRIVDDVTYLNMGALTDGTFLVVDPDDPGGVLGDLSRTLGRADPRDAFAEYAPAVTEVVFVGEQRRGGEELDHYRLVLDLAEVPRLAEQLRGAEAPEPAAMELWLDAESRIRLSHTEVDLMGVRSSTISEMYDFGVAVDVQAPSAGQTTDTLADP